MSRPHLPLDGVTVIDFGQIYNGPYATFLMAMAGARVIKIEPKNERIRQEFPQLTVLTEPLKSVTYR